MSDSTAVLVSTRDLFTDPEAVALGGFLAGYSGLTREAYALDLRQFASWITGHGFRLFEIRRAHIEAFARDLEARGRSRATISRRLCTITCFYRYAEQRGSSNTHQRCMCADPSSTTSPTPSVSIATSWARCSSPPVWPAPATTP